MDPLTQGTAGAVLAQSAANKNNIAKISIVGFLAGLAPDFDVVIRSSTDPTLFLEYHRQFTHSLFFIPFGALIVAALIFPLVRKSLSFRTTYLASFLGYATHGLLDACTSYGTLLFWPFSDERVTWNNISIVDPLLTIPAVILLAVAIKTHRRLYSFIAVGWIVSYLALGLVQYERALSSGLKLAQSRGHSAERMTVKPSFGNLILWKSIYQHEDSFYVDAIHAGRVPSWCVGQSTKIFDYQDHLPDLEKDSQQMKDIEKFRWFSQDYLGFDSDKNLVTDVRYSMIPTQITPMWGLIIDERQGTNEHAVWWSSRDLEDGSARLFNDMLFGDKCKAQS
jgi:inner membrane protein